MSNIVHALDLGLFWPMRLRLVLGEDSNNLRQEVRQALTRDGKWEPIPDLLRRGGQGGDDGFSIAEFNYFHTHIQSFLYGGGVAQSVDQADPRFFDLFALRADLASTFEIVERDWQQSFVIRRIFLYVMEGDLAFLTVQLSAPEPASWRNVLNSVSHLRSVFYPYYQRVLKPGPQGGPISEWAGGGAVDTVRIKPLQASPPAAAGGRAHEVEQTFDAGQPVLLGHWRELLWPLVESGIRVRPLGDHRMAVTAFVGIEDPTLISDDDWFRLVQADDANFLRYAPTFRWRELAASTYDRWWDPSVADPTELKHRYLTGPMTYCSVIGWPAADPPEHLDRIRRSWSRQHYQIFLLAHCQRAVLSDLQDRIARTASRVRTRRKAEFLREIEEIQRDMALFSSRCWFHEVSPQIQGQELYSLIRKQVGLEVLYEEVMQDKALLSNWAAAREERRREARWDVINSVVIPLALLLSALGANVFVDTAKEMAKWRFSTWHPLLRDGFVAAIYAMPVIGWLAYVVLQRRRTKF